MAPSIIKLGGFFSPSGSERKKTKDTTLRACSFELTSPLIFRYQYPGERSYWHFMQLHWTPLSRGAILTFNAGCNTDIRFNKK